MRSFRWVVCPALSLVLGCSNPNGLPISVGQQQTGQLSTSTQSLRGNPQVMVAMDAYVITVTSGMTYTVTVCSLNDNLAPGGWQPEVFVDYNYRTPFEASTDPSLPPGSPSPALGMMGGGRGSGSNPTLNVMFVWTPPYTGPYQLFVGSAFALDGTCERRYALTVTQGDVSATFSCPAPQSSTPCASFDAGVGADGGVDATSGS